MSEKDVVSIDYMEDPVRFADLMNGYYFSGNTVILPEHIHERKNHNVIRKTKREKKKSMVVNRDVVKEVDVLMKTTLIVLENQSDIHYAMPVRVMSGNCAMYHEQWRKISKEHSEKKDTTGAEYVSGFTKDDKLIPVSTIVLYFGMEPWDGPRCLHDMLELEGVPDSIKEYIADYPLHILDVRRFDNYEKFKTDLKWVFGYLHYDQDADKLYEYVNENKEVFSNITDDAFDFIAHFSHSWELAETYKNNNKNIKKEGANMCKAIDDLMARSEKRGFEQGIERGVRGMVQICRETGMSVENTIDRVMSIMTLSKENAEEYVTAYWK